MTDNAAPTGDWNYPTRVRFGAGRIAELADACCELRMNRPLLITDPGLAKLPMVQDALAATRAAGLETGLFFDIRSNPVGRNIEDGLKHYRGNHHDGVVAFGGGSAIDAAKGIALMVGQDRAIWDFEDIGDNWKRAHPKGIARIVAVPTTAGTGSEVGRAAVIIDEATHTKKIIHHPRLLPGQVICDPALTLGLPAAITAATGMDALAHNLEAYCAPAFHPMADGIAAEGVRLVREWLPTAVKDGRNLAARSYMMAASSMGATAFQKGLGAIHTMSHPIGALYDTHHGLTNAVVMPYVLAFNRPAIEARLDRLARYIGLAEASFTGVMDWVLALREEIGIPHTLADIGVDDGRIDLLSEMASHDPNAATNPRPIGVAEHRQLFAASIEGRLP